MKRKKLLRCHCGQLFENDGVFITCPQCRIAFTESQRRSQTGCKH